MWRFFVSILIFCGFLLGLTYVLLFRPLTQLDPFYAKSTHTAASLILGGSRAGQGISPQVLQKELGRSEDMLNFAFNAYQTPYGPSYYELIARKMRKDVTDGLYILSVNAGLLTDDAKVVGLREEEFDFYDLYCVSMNPNLEYMMRDIGAQRTGQLSPLLRLVSLGGKRARKRICHADGWFEVFPPNRKVNPNKDVPEVDWIGTSPVRNPVRIAYLKKTIELLQPHGQVVITRLPAGPYFWQEEGDVYPDFDEEMSAIADQYQVPYLNFFKEPYVFHDIRKHHLSSEGARTFSADLARAIRDWQINY